jgi:hypothetical protein
MFAPIDEPSLVAETPFPSETQLNRNNTRYRN